jgi:tol-pal system protein YbgF
MGTQNLTVAQRLERLERSLTARSQAEFEQQKQLSDLANELADLTGTLERHSYEIEQMVVRQREIYQEIDRRFAQMTEELKTSQSTPVAEQQAVTVSEEQAYDSAVALVMRNKDFERAIPAFEAFLNDYPESGYAANAHYWLGQLLYTQGKTELAAQQFLVVVDKYPQSNKVAESMVKLGVIAAQSGDKAKAQDLFEQVLAKFPNSSAADLAQGQLSKLKR